MHTSNGSLRVLLVVALLAAMAVTLLAGCEASGYYDGSDEPEESTLLQLP